MPQFKDHDELTQWLSDRPREDGLIIAARAALRVVPMIGAGDTLWRNKVLLLSLRGVALPLINFKYRSDITDYSRSLIHLKAATANIDLSTKRISSVINGSYDTITPHNDLATIAYAISTTEPSIGNATISDRIFKIKSNITTQYQLLDAISHDISTLNTGTPAPRLADAPLWLFPLPVGLAATWVRMRSELASEPANWDVWTDWYDALLEGRLAESKAISVARVTLPEEFWDRGPRAVNAELKRLIEAERAQTPPLPIPESSDDAANTADGPAPPPPLPLPLQGHGPHFDLPQGRLDFTPPAKLDGSRNDLRRLRALHPLLRDQAAVAVELFGRNAAHGRLFDVLAQYSAALNHQVDGIDYEILTGIGLQLANAETSARREIADRLKPEFEDDEKAALTSVLDLHGPFVLASEAGRNLLDDVERYRRSEADEAAFREDAAVLAAALVESPAVAAPEPAAFIAATVAEIGRGDNPSRTAVYGVGVVKNATVVLAGGAVAFTLATLGVVAGGMWIGTGGIPAWVIYKGIEASKPFKETTKLIADLADAAAEANWTEELGALRERNLRAVADFVRTHSDRLDRLAGDRREWQWLRDLLKWLREVDRR